MSEFAYFRFRSLNMLSIEEEQEEETGEMTTNQVF